LLSSFASILNGAKDQTGRAVMAGWICIPLALGNVTSFGTSDTGISSTVLDY
jgi:hypothetical protein